jgi:hypothetical protein
MTQVNGYAYLSNGGYGPALRWDGFFYCSGTATCTGNATVTINGAIGDTAFADVRQGDQIYLKDHSQGAYGGVWQFGQCATILSRDTVAGTLTLEGNGFATTAKGPGGSNNVDFVIVRVHQMGVAAAPTSSATLGAAGGALAAGTKYYYTFRYKNSHTGYSGNLAAVSNATTDSSKLQITVAGWATRPADRDVNEIEVFRSLDGAVWKRLNCGTTSKNLEADPTTGNFAANLNDNGLALLEEIDTYYAYHDRPASASLGKMRWFNSHLWARGTNTTGNGPHWLYWSTLDNYEYWPTQEFGTDNPASTFPLLGGCMQIGAHAGEYITAIFPEGGNYEYTGNSGTNLLVLTRQKAVRVYGYDWTDFAQLPAFDEGCVYHKSGAVGNGRLFWLSHKGPMMLVAGTNDPVPIYQALWPRGIAEHMYVSPRNTYLAGASGVCWNECYVLTCCTGTNTANSEVYVYHIPTNTWTQMHSDADMAGYNDLQSLAGTPTGSVEMPVDGMDITSTDTNRRVYAMFSKCGQPAASSSYGVNTYRKYAGGVVGITARWLSQPIYIDEGVGSIVGAYKVRAQFRAASTAQTITLKLYADGDTSSAIWTGAATIPAVTANSNKRVWVEWMPTKRSGKLLQFELSGTFTEQIELERFDTGLIKQGN